jgi:hypothetical protein
MGEYAGEIRTAALIAQALVQGPMFLQDHLFALEVESGQNGQLNLGLPCPVETGTAGASLSARCPAYLPRLIGRVERMTEPRGIAYTLTARYDGQVQGFLGNGLHAVEATIVPSVQFVSRVQLPVGETVEAAILRDIGELRDTLRDDVVWETKTEAALDVAIAGRKGVLGYRELGIGKTWQISVGNERSPGEYVDALGAFLETGEFVELLAPLGSTTATCSAQARRTRGFGAKLVIDATAAAGGLDEASAKWTDPGRKFEIDMTAAEAIETIRDAIQATKDLLTREPGEMQPRAE